MTTRRVVTLLIFTLTLAALAQASLITNGSFENTNNTFVGDANKVDELPSGSSAIPGWTTGNGVPTAWIQNGDPYGISASRRKLFSRPNRLFKFWYIWQRDPELCHRRRHRLRGHFRLGLWW